MGFNYGLEKRKFTEEWKKLYSENKAAGMREEDIQDIYVHVKENTEYLLDTDKTFRAFYDLSSKPATTENTAATPEDAQ